MELLQNGGPMLVPIEAHADWRQAVMAAGHRHYFNQLIATLPHVYEGYSQHNALGIRFLPPNASSRPNHPRGSSFARHDEVIREGRRLLGEPDDLDF